jgi:hypothetical protein
VSIPGRKQPLRHLIAVSEALHANGAAGKTYLLNYECSLAWSTLVSFLGLPADPRWSKWLIDWLERENKIHPVQGIGCEPVMVIATREELLQAVAKGLQGGALSFPRENGPILWPSFRVQTFFVEFLPCFEIRGSLVESFVSPVCGLRSRKPCLYPEPYTPAAGSMLAFLFAHQLIQEIDRGNILRLLARHGPGVGPAHRSDLPCFAVAEGRTCPSS